MGYDIKKIYNQGERMEIKFKKLSKDAITPKLNNALDVGFDLFSAETVVIPGFIGWLFGKKNRALIKTNIAWQPVLTKKSSKPFLEVKDTSGNAWKIGVSTMAGIIDPNYTGDIGVILKNTNLKKVVVKKGDKIAQAILLETPVAKIIEVNELNKTERGNKGYGSSGKIGD